MKMLATMVTIFLAVSCGHSPMIDLGPMLYRDGDLPSEVRVRKTIEHVEYDDPTEQRWEL